MTGPAPGQLTRRGFLVLGGGTAAVLGLGGYGLSIGGVESAVASSSTVLSGGYPRVLAFRQTEKLVPENDYDHWAALFAPFSGIIGKALQEERTDVTGPHTVEYFTRFKQQNPTKLVILHLNARARLPRFETDGWSAGWWLYRAGTTFTAAVEPEATVLKVKSTGPFRLTADRFGGIGDDVVIAPMGANGRPDFTEVEQVRVSAIDAAAKSLKVVRGQYGTSPLPFPKGAYLAPHVYAGPWSDVDDRVWLYNLATTCPPDASGRRLLDVLLAQFASWFGTGGMLAAFDGVELDVFMLENRDRVDADCDGVVDSALQNGVDTYLHGQIQLTKGIRQILGPGRYLLTDGNIGQQPDFASVNGVELEGFPTSRDYGMRLWSQAVMTLELWRRRGAPQRLSYPIYMFAPPNDYPVSFNRFRLTLAAALATNSAVTWGNEPGGSRDDPPNRVVVYDEFVAGTLGQPGWLGAPRGERIHLAERQPDLLSGAGVSWPKSFTSTFTGPGVMFAALSPSSPVLVVTRRQPSTALSFTIPARPLSGPDVVLALDLLADARAGYPASIGRRCTVTVVGAGGDLTQMVTVPTTFFHTVLGFHGIGPGPVQITISVEGDAPLRLRGLRMFAAPDAIVREFTEGAVFANPSGHDVSFDVADLLPGGSFVRLTGSANQDPTTNDGSTVGSTLTMGPLDALVVRAV